MAYQIGDRVGDYEVVGYLGAGGMGKVYKVKNVLSDRVEAMKVLLPNLTENTDVMDRFLREIKVLGSLDHPNIAALRTAQRVDNQVLMLMEYIEGKPLDDLLHRGAMRREFGLSFIAQVLSALDYAHARGIVHRDIKPSNIMVTASGQVKLMDFGIAKLQADRKLTATGSTLGSLYYMSPEQIQGADSVDARSDLYALGICLYEVATGQRPFDADSEYSLMSKHLNESPRPPLQLDPTIPDSLNQIVLMAIAKDPKQRFQSAAAMLAALNSVRKELGFEVKEPGPAAAAAAPVAPATPPPVKAAPPASQPAPQAQQAAALPPPTKSRRGLYMALGSLVTVGVVVGALLLVPKYLRTGAAGTQQTPAPVVTQPAQTTPSPAVNPPVETPTVQPAASVPEPSPAHQTAKPEPRTSVARQPTVPAVRPPASAPVSQQPPQQSAPAQAAPVQQTAPAQPSAQDRQAAAAHQAAMNEAREQYNLLAIRAGTAKSGLQGVQNQMGGMNLRADIRETAARMDYLMQEAMTSLRAGDVENAKRNMDMANRAIETLEKFLGR